MNDPGNSSKLCKVLKEYGFKYKVNRPHKDKNGNKRAKMGCVKIKKTINNVVYVIQNETPKKDKGKNKRLIKETLSESDRETLFDI